MVILVSEDNETILNFEGASHRLFIEGRGFDFDRLIVNSKGKAELFLPKSDDSLYTYLDFEEPRFVYVISRVGVKDLILQGCRLDEVSGNNCILSFSKLQTEA